MSKVRIAGMNHGEPPENVKQQQEHMDWLLQSGNADDVAPVLSPPPAQELSMPADPSTTVTRIMPPIRRRRAKLEYRPETQGVAGFALEFDIVDVDINEYSITLLTGPDFKFVPTDVVKLVLTVDRRTFVVVYAGGSFAFQPNLHGLSFIRNNDDQDGSNQSR
jgi:hypothetical protein